MSGNDSIRFAGPLLLLFGPAIFFVKKWPPAIRVSFFISFLSYFFWFLGNEFARYLAPVYPCMALTLAFAWVSIANGLPEFMKWAMTLSALGIALAVWGPIALIVKFTFSPWQTLTGQINREEFLSYTRGTYPNPSYKMYQYINKNLPTENTRILLLGENKAFHLKRDFYYYTVEYNNPILQTWISESKDDAELYEKFKQAGISHMMINYREFIRLHAVQWEPKPKEILEKFWNRHVLDMPYFAEGVYLYEIAPEIPKDRTPALNLILELDKRGWKQQSFMQIFMDNRMWSNAIDEVESWARWGSPVFGLLADLYLNRNQPGDAEKAVQIFQFAINRTPQDLVLYTRLASLLMQKSQFVAAYDVVRRDYRQSSTRAEPRGRHAFRVRHPALPSLRLISIRRQNC